jgi:ATP-dependent DNA helicase RecQ
MSRARETLHLFSLASCPNPHVAVLIGDFVISRHLASDIEEPHKTRTYSLLGMEDLFVDFVGIKPENHPSRIALKKIKTGDRLNIEKRNKNLELVNSEGVVIARLSRKAKEEWYDRIGIIRDIRTVALVKRYREDLADKAFQASCLGDSWDVPIVEFVV